ncbi:uncharacterized protein LOC135480448 [Liolophura sinensis]|uniref:uncharacterized protein LOC135480448 n=1 Tax=Liolophura sinensis TaxID=3198878 RepID=UPI00315891E9
MERQNILLKPVLALSLVLAFTSGFAMADYWTNWYDFDNGGGSGDYERIQDHPTAADWRPCGGRVKERIEAREVGTTDVISTKDHLTVGPNYGLYCSNGAISGYCQDYAVQYCTAADVCSGWKDVNNPGFTDDERKILHGVLPAPVEYIKIRDQSIPFLQYTVYQQIKLSPRYGLLCLNSRQSCKDYEVRYYCGDYPKLGFRIEG